MRDYLFRGKRVDNSEWVQGFLTKRKFAGKEYFAIEQSERKIVTYDYEYVMQPYEIIPETVGQFIGLTDKNGKKIFEGDIVKGTFLGFPIPIKDYVFCICWQEDVAGYRANYFENVEVVGNIHDNPALLKGGEEE